MVGRENVRNTNHVETMSREQQKSYLRMIIKQIASVLFTIGGAVMNALTFSGINFLFIKFTDHGEKERKRHDLALSRLHIARGEQNKDRTKLLQSIHKRLREMNESKAYINNLDKPMLEYCQVFAKQRKP